MQQQKVALQNQKDGEFPMHSVPCTRSIRLMRCIVAYIRPKPGPTLSITLAAHTLYAVQERNINSATAQAHDHIA